MKRTVKMIAALALTMSLSVYGSWAVAAGPSGAFADVLPDSWYAPYVQWAVREGITSGTSANTFSPDATCTVSQILTLLWRERGMEQAGISNPFADVAQGEYYFDAALWAHKKGLVTESVLNGGQPCTRAMLVTYLWKLNGSPSANQSSFADVPADAPYAKAVDWAVATGLTQGTSATAFSPDMVCTRSQCVAFLFRNAAPYAAVYDRFIKNREYASITDQVMQEFELEPKQYALCDVDQNGIPELLISSETLDIFQYTCIFAYDSATGNVVLVDWLYHASEIEYAPAFQALACSEMRYSGFMGSVSFYRLERQKLQLSFVVGWDSSETPGYSYVDFPGTERQSISSADRETYVISSTNRLSFTELPKNSSQVQGSQKADLIQYYGQLLSKCKADFPFLKGNPSGLWTKDGTVSINANVPEGSQDPNNKVDYISLNGSSEFCIMGVECGMSLDEADAILKEKGATTYDKKHYSIPGIEGTLRLSTDKNTSMIEQVQFPAWE